MIYSGDDKEELDGPTTAGDYRMKGSDGGRRDAGRADGYDRMPFLGARLLIRQRSSPHDVEAHWLLCARKVQQLAHAMSDAISEEKAAALLDARISAMGMDGTPSTEATCAPTDYDLRPRSPSPPQVLSLIHI